LADTQERDADSSELAKLRQQVEELRQSVRARDDFIAIAAHELRNPMTPVIGVAELALVVARKAEGTCPPRVIELLERLQGLVQDYMNRATRLLDISRVEAGKLQLQPAVTDLSNLVRSVAQRYEAEAAYKRCAIEPGIDDGIIAVCDPLAVEQVIENLLSNALKFGAGNPVVLRLRSDEDSAYFEVRDSGIGMSEEQQERVFDRFEQVVAHHRAGGFGLGLWISCRLVEAMNGNITLSSRLGHGSTFHVTLPLRAASDRSATA
jgi:two-component system OmpR family sensor kinase